jgi:transposase
MFIRKTTHTHNKNGQKYYTYKLVESIRTDRGPRQRPVLNLGADFTLPMEKWKELADRIEAVISGQFNLFPVPEEIEQLAQRYARTIIRRHGQRSTVVVKNQSESDFQTVDVNSLENEQIRSVGGESVVLATIKELELDLKLEALGFNRPNLEAAIGVITARLLAPTSERETHLWLQNETSLDDLMETSFESLSQDRVYKVSDMLLRNKEAIECHLQNRERHLFNLEEKILLYDLTNTFFEGSGKYNRKAHFGVSKEKRSDCPLVTLALLMDADGFPKKSEILEGNVSEPGTLEKIVPAISTAAKKPIIVMDAGIGTQKNIKWMSDNEYHYIVVSRKRKPDIPAGMEMVKIRENNRRVIRAALRINTEGEMEVCCHSTAKEIKEREIKNRFERRFEDKLAEVQRAIHKKYGTKKYDKVLEKIGRLKERYRRVARRYEISVEKNDESGNVVNITWRMKQLDETSGYYVLRSNLTSRDEKEVFDMFTMLLDLEDAFRSMKSELGLRPVYHQIEYRCDGHLFITVLAYHVLHSIRLKLKNHGITYSWSTIRSRLATHYRVTTSMKRSDGKMFYVRKTAKPEVCHTIIYDALGLPHRPGKISKAIL